MKTLLGKYILITGAASGLGAATATACARHGANIAINFLPDDCEAAYRVAQECRDVGVETLLLPGDVSDVDSCDAMAARIRDWSHLDALINNAATTVYVPDHGDLGALDKDDFLRIYAVNVVGPFQMIRSMRPYLEVGASKGQASSAVLNISSIAGLNGGGVVSCIRG